MPENTVNMKMEVDSHIVKLLGIEDVLQASFSDSSLFFHFSNSNIGFNVLDRSCAKAYPSKKQKHVKEKKNNRKQIRPYKKCQFYKKK